MSRLDVFPFEILSLAKLLDYCVMLSIETRPLVLECLKSIVIASLCENIVIDEFGAQTLPVDKKACQCLADKLFILAEMTLENGLLTD